jgi:hypothetical protein
MLLAVFALMFLGPILAGVAICLALALTLVRLVTWFAQDVADASVSTKKDWCGPQGSPFISWLVPEVPFGIDLRDACKNHDECYAAGATKVDKLTCDGLLGIDANDDCNAQGNDHMCGLVAFTYQFAVTFLGLGAFNDKK